MKTFVNLSFWQNFGIDLQKNCNSSTKNSCVESMLLRPLVIPYCHGILCSLDPRPVQWKPIRLLPPSPTLSLSFFEYFLSFPGTRRCSTHLKTSCLSPGIGPFSLEPWLFLLRRAFRNQGLTRCVHCRWGVIASGLRKGIHVPVCMVMHVCTTYTNTHT